MMNILNKSRSVETKMLLGEIDTIHDRLKYLIGDNVNFMKAYEVYNSRESFKRQLNKELIEFAGITLIN